MPECAWHLARLQEPFLPGYLWNSEGVWLTFRVKERDNAQLALSHIKRVFEVMPGIGVLQLVKIDQVRPGDKAGLLRGQP